MNWNCRWIELTSSGDLDPNAPQFEELEDKIIHGFTDTDHRRSVRTIGALERTCNSVPFPVYTADGHKLFKRSKQLYLYCLNVTV
jgi:hypothetical protein